MVIGHVERVWGCEGDRICRQEVGGGKSADESGDVGLRGRQSELLDNRAGASMIDHVEI